MKGILKRTKRNGWLVRYKKCCIDENQNCEGAKSICEPETIILPLHPDSWIWLEEYPISKYVFEILNDDNEAEVEFEFFEVPIFRDSGLAEDIDYVLFAKLKTK
jgi:hypothetical protein